VKSVKLSIPGVSLWERQCGRTKQLHEVRLGQKAQVSDIKQRQDTDSPACENDYFEQV
jgi:hypothetical protein